jgi:hypothetical protein
MLLMTLNRPSLFLEGASDIHEWAQMLLIILNGPKFFSEGASDVCECPGPIYILINAANNFGWAQIFFKGCFRCL